MAIVTKTQGAEQRIERRDSSSPADAPWAAAMDRMPAAVDSGDQVASSRGVRGAAPQIAPAGLAGLRPPVATRPAASSGQSPVDRGGMGAALVSSVQGALEIVPKGFIDALDDPKFARYVMGNAERLALAAGGDPSAVRELIDALPAGPFKTEQQQVAKGLSATATDDSFAESPLGIGASGLGLMAGVFTHELVQPAIGLATKSSVRLGTLLGRIREGALTPELADRLLAGNVRPPDVGALLRLLRDSSANGKVVVDAQGPEFKALTADIAWPPMIDIGSVTEIEVGPGDTLKLRFNGKPFVPGAKLDLDFGRELSLSINALEQAPARLEVSPRFGTALEFAFAGWHIKPTGTHWLDVAIDLLLKVLLSPLLLVLGLVGEISGAKYVWQDDGDAGAKMWLQALGQNVRLAG